MNADRPGIAGRPGAVGSAVTPPDELDLPPELVTGEAVALDLRSASFASRALAIALDLVIILVVAWTAVILVVSLSFALDDAASAALLLVTEVMILVGIPVTVETLTRGRSVGKLAAGLRVVRDDGGPVRFRHALIRGLLGILEFYISWGSIPLIVSLLNKRGKRVGDILAGTYVVRARGGRPLPPPVGMPPELAGWAFHADLGRLPDRLAMAVRQFLARVGALHPTSRQRLGVELATQVARYVAPPPPAGVHPERFLAAVMAERRRRDLDRLLREQAAQFAREQRRQAASPLSSTGTRLIGS
jgi:uncharacterized RDD family membrane protein YckC